MKVSEIDFDYKTGITISMEDGSKQRLGAIERDGDLKICWYNPDFIDERLKFFPVISLDLFPIPTPDLLPSNQKGFKWPWQK